MAPEQIALLTKRAARGEPAVSFQCTAFMPGEAADITGASHDYQKALRRRGFLHHTGHARFDVIGVADLFLTRMLGDRGGPKLAKNFAATASWGVAWHTMAYNHSWSGDHERALTWDPALAPRIEAWRAATAQLRHRSDWDQAEAEEELTRVAGDPAVQAFNAWELQSLWLRDQMFRLRGFTKTPVPQFAVWTPSGRTAFCASLDRAFAEDGQHLIGPVVVLDLARLGWTLLTKMKEVTGGRDTFVTVTIGNR